MSFRLRGNNRFHQPFRLLKQGRAKSQEKSKQKLCGADE